MFLITKKIRASCRVSTTMDYKITHVSYKTRTRLQTTSTTSTFSTSRIGGNGCNVLDSSDLDSVTCQCSKSRLSSRSERLGLGSSGGSQFDVKSGNSALLASFGHVLSGKHSSIRRRLISISFHFHTSRDSGDGLTSGEIRDVNKGIVETSVDVSDLCAEKMSFRQRSGV